VLERLSLQRLASMSRQLNISRTNYSANLSYIGLYRKQASWQSTKEIDEIHRTIHIVTHCLGLSDVPQPLIYPIVSAK